ncbi:MAG: hypothetical protein Q9165_005269 [Trypethelium subeluteriae]
MFSGTDDTEFYDRFRAREDARKQNSDDIRRRNEQDRRRDREAEERHQAQIERDRNLYREERRRSREEAERTRRLEELREREKEDQERIARVERDRLERRERQRRDDERRRRRAAARESEDLRQRFRYQEPEAFPSYYGTARAPPPASPRRPHVDVSYGEQYPSMRYPPPPSPRDPPRMTYHRPTDHYDERHATYYGEGQPGTRIQQHTSSWWPSRQGIFRRNTYSGGYPAYRDRDRERAHRRAMFWGD